MSLHHHWPPLLSGLSLPVCHHVPDPHLQRLSPERPLGQGVTQVTQNHPSPHLRPFSTSAETPFPEGHSPNPGGWDAWPPFHLQGQTLARGVGRPSAGGRWEAQVRGARVPPTERRVRGGGGTLEIAKQRRDEGP